jgi:hypothetical protein
MSESWLEMMLDRPEGIESRLFGGHHLIQYLVKYLILALAMFERACNLNLVKDTNVHGTLLSFWRAMSV